MESMDTKQKTKTLAIVLTMMLFFTKANAQEPTNATNTTEKHVEQSQESILQTQANKILSSYEAQLCRILHELYISDLSLAQKIYTLEHNTTSKFARCSDSVYTELNNLIAQYSNNTQNQMTIDNITKRFYSVGVRYEKLRQEMLSNIRNEQRKNNQRFADSLSKPWKEYKLQEPLTKPKER